MESRLHARSGGHLKREKKKWVKMSAATALTTALLAGAGMGAASIANAADTPGMYNTGIEVQVPPPGAFGDWKMYLGSMNLNGTAGGGLAFCMDVGVDAGPVGDGSQSAINNAVLNYVISANEGDTSKHTAISYLVHENADPKFNNPWNGSGTPYGNLRDSTDPQLVQVRATAATLWADAVANAGPYKVQPQLSVDSDGRTGTVKNTSLISAAGNAQSGYTGTAVLSGPAVWTGSNSQSVAIHGGERLGFTATGNGTVSVNVTYNQVPGSTATAFKKAGFQQLLVADSKIDVAGKSADAPVIFDFQPVATSTAVKYVEAGDKLTDVLHVKTSDGLSWLKDANGTPIPAVFEDDVYYSPVALADKGKVPSAAKLFTTGKATANGVGDISPVFKKTADKAGYYYYVAKFVKASQPADLRKYFTKDWSAGFNDPDELTIQKYTPKVHTKTAEIANGKIHDVITITGNNPEVKLDVVSKLIMTNADTVPAGTDKAPADAQIITTLTTSKTGNGDVPTADADVPWSKIIAAWAKGEKPKLYWQETIAATESTKPWVGKHLLPAETVKTQKPMITTQASENGTVPLDMHDTGIVSGTIPSGDGVKVTTKVEQFKFDGSTDGSAQAVCVNPFYESPWQKVTTTKVTYPTHKTEFVGTYGYVETLKVSVTTGGKTTETVLHTGKCGEKNETVIAFPKDVPPTPEKPQLPNVPVTPEKPVTPVAPQVPMVPAGNVATETGPNTGLIIGGSALALAGLTLASVMIVRRRKNQAQELADTK